MKSLGVIPARYASTRFPGKPLVEIAGTSMVARVYAQAKKSQLTDVVVATDDQRILDHVLAIGGNAVMTSSSHKSGTDRCAEVAQVAAFREFDCIVNIQGDEPFIDPEHINAVLHSLRQGADFQIATLAKAIASQEDLFNPNVVKVVVGNNGNALYFSRSAIPFVRGKAESEWLNQGVFYKHIGIYGFLRDALIAVAGCQEGKLEKMESLEQLRWLEHGYRIGVSITKTESVSIDTPADLEKALKMLGH